MNQQQKRLQDSSGRSRHEVDTKQSMHASAKESVDRGKASLPILAGSLSYLRSQATFALCSLVDQVFSFLHAFAQIRECRSGGVSCRAMEFVITSLLRCPHRCTAFIPLFPNTFRTSRVQDSSRYPPPLSESFPFDPNGRSIHFVPIRGLGLNSHFLGGPHQCANKSGH